MNTFVHTFNQAAAAWWVFVVNVSWQASLLAVLLVCLVLIGRRWPSPLRYWLLVLALVKFALPPMVSLPTGLFARMGTVVAASAEAPIGRLAILAGPDAGTGQSPTMDAADAPIQNASLAHVSIVPASETPTHVSLDARSWLMILHFLGAIAVAGWIVHELQVLRGILRRSVELASGDLHRRFVQLGEQLGLRNSPRLLVTKELAGPAAFGLWSPVVVLPEGVMHIEPAEMNVILAHELAHHRRHDLWLNAAQVGLTVIWWFNPCFWLLNRLIRKVREDCCDDLLLTRNLTTGPAYCETLLHAASAVTGPKSIGVTLGFGEQFHSMGRRFERLMDSTLRRTGRLSLLGGCFIIFLAGLVLPGLNRSNGGESNQESPLAETKMTTISSPPKASNADENDALVIAGRVVDPSGKPFAGAKLYAMVKSSVQMPPKLRDPNTKIVERKKLNGKEEAYAVHPGLIAIMKKHGLDSTKPLTQDMLTRPDLMAEVQELQKTLYEEHPFQMPTVRATSGPDGRFRFTLAKAWLRKSPHEDVEVYAFADNYGPGWAWASKDEELGDLTVRLVHDTPIQGRIIDLEGRPAPGVVVKLGTIIVGADGTTKIWQEFVKAALAGDNSRHNELLGKLLERQMLYNNLPQIPKSVTTDKEGRFTIRGIGADRLLFKNEITGPGVGHDVFSIVTCADTGIPPSQPPRNPLPAEYRTYPATFDHIVNPVRVLTGTLRDTVTGKPIEGVQVAAWGPAYVDSITDKEGRYKLVGLSKAKDYSVTIWPFNVQRNALPYINTDIRIRDTPGLEPLTTDVKLVRGVVLHGRLLEKATGKPIGGRAQVWYATFKDNPHAAAFAFSGNPKFANQREFIGVPFLQQTHANIGPDGTFQLVVLPGRGVLGVRVEQGNFAQANLPEADKDRQFWSKTVPIIAHATKEFQAAKFIEVPENVAELKTELTVESIK
jgi:beta-lactamase regulating signal transducer with metallopeptidase domain